MEHYTPIVREPDVARLAAAARAILVEFDRLRRLVGHRPEVLAQLFADRALAADDAHGRRHGLVGLSDGVRWAELEALADAAGSGGVDPSVHAEVGHWHADCPDCAAVLAMARIRARHRYRTVGPGESPLAPDGIERAE